MTPKLPSQGLWRFLPVLVHKWKPNVLFVGALVGRPSCWVVVCIFNVHPGQCQCHQWKAHLTPVTPSSVLFPHIWGSNSSRFELNQENCYSYSWSGILKSAIFYLEDSKFSCGWGGPQSPDCPLIRCHSSHCTCHFSHIGCNWWQYSGGL